ncbi:hypothetical protein DFH07DRAFT_784614 [Mycena maculata]|uniref:Uncharacterized protein n=1 Tax=Mycena maculata TaxID=230809 RepID=A0AAD7HGE1_9AGAR|nr:hypothetical protein DFH07DRAFT_784614 [Mycena maculata]
MRRHGIISILAADSAYLRAEWEDKSVERGAEEDGQRADWKGACQEEEEMTRAGRAGEKEGRECRRGRLDKPRLGQGPRVAQGSEEGVAIGVHTGRGTYKEVRQWEAWLEQIKAVGRARVGAGGRRRAAGGSGREGLGTRERRRGVAWHRHGRIDNEGKEARPMGGVREVGRAAIVEETKGEAGGGGRGATVKAGAFGTEGRERKRPGVVEQSQKGAPNEWEVHQSAGRGGRGARNRETDRPRAGRVMENFEEVLQSSGRCAKRVAATPVTRHRRAERGCMWAKLGYEVLQVQVAEISQNQMCPKTVGYSENFDFCTIPRCKSCGGSNSSVLDLEIGQGGLINMRNDYRPLSAVKSDGNKVFRTKNLGGPRFDQPPPTVYPAVWIFFSEGSEHWEQ